MRFYDASFFCKKDGDEGPKVYLDKEGTEFWPISITINSGNSKFSTPRVMLHLEDLEQLRQFIYSVNSEWNRIIGEEVEEKDE
jgi:hypothetical protein